MIRIILNICITNSLFSPKELSVLSPVCKLNNDEKKILKKVEKQWFDWKFQNVIDTFYNLKQQFYAISRQLLYPIQVTEELEDEQQFYVHKKKSVLQETKVIIKELNFYPQLLQDYDIDQTKIFMTEILEFLRSQIYDDILYKQPYNYLIYDDFQLNHELLEIFIIIMSKIGHFGETKHMLQEQCLQLLSEKMEQLYYNNLTLLSLNDKKIFGMQITKLELLVKRQMQPLEKQPEFFTYQLKLINDVMDKSVHDFDIITTEIELNYNRDLKKSQLELLKLLSLPWTFNMNSYINLDCYDLEHILSSYYLEERVEVLHQLIN